MVGRHNRASNRLARSRSHRRLDRLSTGFRLIIVEALLTVVETEGPSRRRLKLHRARFELRRRLSNVGMRRLWPGP
ncbi:MAG: hypothetical protein J2P45_18415 [Candidatus Dormibacteraeota bacterium]|nr:hypothetical protein [Candidatus Dormibacteraeota bacterium]